MTPSRYSGRSALVTGASSGIGEAFASALAARGANLLLTALPEEHDQLEELASKLSASHGVRTKIVALDLTALDGPRTLAEHAARVAFEPTVLVNNAGFGLGGPFVDQPIERQLAMIRLNVSALVALTGEYLPRMVERGEGVVVNIASTAAFQPLPYFAVYSATKAFVLSFGEALWAEVRSSGVRVTTVCSGPVSTPFHERAGDRGQATGLKRQVRRRYLTADSVVAAAFEAIEDDRPRVVLRLPGGRVVYGAASAVTLFLPRRREVLAIERFSRWLFPPE